MFSQASLEQIMDIVRYLRANKKPTILDENGEECYRVEVPTCVMGRTIIPRMNRPIPTKMVNFII